MNMQPLRIHGSRAALAAGIIGAAATIFLILFFTLEAPRGIESPNRFGFLSDLLPVFAAPPAVIVCIVMFLALRKNASRLSAVTALLGITGIAIVTISYLLYTMQWIDLNTQIAGYLLHQAPMGAWYILVSSLARRSGFLPPRLAKFGILVGSGQIISFILLYLLGGYSAMVSTSPAMIPSNIPLLIALIIGTPAGTLGYLGPPIWLIWLGLALRREGYQREYIPGGIKNTAG
jgi:hypothetical protein